MPCDGELDDKLTKKMTAWEDKRQKHLADMERRRTDKYCHQSGSSDVVISLAEHQVQKNVEACETQMWVIRLT